MKKMQLSERSEFCIFRNGFALSWEPNEVRLEAVARAFCVLFCGEKSTEKNALHVNIIYFLELMNIIFTK
ncbi:hypothetical protein KKA17_04680 [bacterium]|nr:hypothetical protein [bacterium]